MSAKGTSWDDHPADVRWVVDMDCPSIIWGGQFFQLPVARGWLVWDKLMSEFSTSVCELAWSNIEQPVRRLYYASASALRDGRVHPTQKPVALMAWCLRFLPAATTILDAYMGSGTTGVACVREGRQFIGVEIDPEYFDIACERIRKEMAQHRFDLPAPAKPTQGSLFQK